MQDSEKGPNLSENAAILDRLAAIKGWKRHGSNRKIAEFLGVSETVVSNWRTRSPIDLAVLKEKLDAREFQEVVYPDSVPAYQQPTPGFPEREIIRATELVHEFMGAGKLSPVKLGGYISTVAEMLVQGESESEIRALLAPPIRSLALAEAKRQPPAGP